MIPSKTKISSTGQRGVKFVRPMLSLVMLSLLGACAAPSLLKKAEVARPEGSEYAAALYAGYLEQARLEIDEADYPDSAHFSIKAIDAADGGDVQPDLMADRSLGKQRRPELVEARQRLMEAKSELVIEIAPRSIAGAQVAFDCWMQEAEENRQPEDIAACRRNFELSLARAEAALTEHQAQIAALQVIAPAAAPPSPVQTLPEPGPYTVHFPFDSADITEAAASILDQAATAFIDSGSGGIQVAGHTDRSGSVIYNEALSRKRAEAVVQYLTRRGIEDNLIEAAWHGENLPELPTEDGARESQNRRVLVQAAGQEHIAAK